MVSVNINYTVSQAPVDIWDSRINILCDCPHKLKVQLICRGDPACPNVTQRLYCEECRDELKHTHKPF